MVGTLPRLCGLVIGGRANRSDRGGGSTFGIQTAADLPPPDTGPPFPEDPLDELIRQLQWPAQLHPLLASIVISDRRSFGRDGLFTPHAAPSQSVSFYV